MADSSRADQAIEVLQSNGFEEVTARPVVRVPVRQLRASPEADRELDRRLENWSNTVHADGGGSSKASSAWATAYVAARNKRELLLAMELNIVTPSSALSFVDVNELDGWLVEKAVCSLGDFNQKKALQLRYCWGRSDEFIRSRLGLRGRDVPLVIGRARRNLQEVLAKVKSPARIRSYNLNAGNPCPDANVAP